MITFKLKKMLLLCGLAGILGAFISCNDNDEEIAVEKKPNISVIIWTTGKGENDYNSLIYKAIEKWENNPGVDMTVHFPKTMEEATKIYKDWAVKTANNGVKSLMIPANGGYLEMVQNTPLELKDNQEVLAFEMTLPQPLPKVKTFEISHTGISFLAGKMASKCQEASVFVGCFTPMLKKAAEDFQKGFGNDERFTCLEISKNFDGFNMPDSAKRMAMQHRDAFILPLAGSSNNGVYDFLKECGPEDCVMAAGMDINCNYLSKRIPFSYIINIDKAIDLHLQCWYEGKPWPEEVLGLENGMSSIIINPDFQTTGGVSLADLEELYDTYFEEAAAMDK